MSLKIVHMADSHLGFSSFSRVDKNGRNLIEEKIYEGFDQAIDRIIQLNPDAVVHAGDVFHHVRPRIRPLYIFKKSLARLSEADIPVIIIAGNHDAPKSHSYSSPFLIYEDSKNLSIAHRNQYERFEVGNYNFHCIPFCLEQEDYLEEFSKIKRSERDVLVMHGLMESLRNKKLRTLGEHELKDSLLKSDFDYIALGHYHSQAQISGNTWYSGSIEYFNFGEASDKKGILYVDLDTRVVHQIEIRRKYMIDRPAIDCSGMSSAELSEVLHNVCDPDKIRDQILRINLENVSRSAYKNLNYARLSKLTSAALYFKIKIEYDDEKERIDDMPVNALQLHEDYAKFLDDEDSRNMIPKSIRGDVKTYGCSLLKKAVTAHSSEAMDVPE